MLNRNLLEWDLDTILTICDQARANARAKNNGDASEVGSDKFAPELANLLTPVLENFDLTNDKVFSELHNWSQNITQWDNFLKEKYPTSDDFFTREIYSYHITSIKGSVCALLPLIKLKQQEALEQLAQLQKITEKYSKRLRTNPIYRNTIPGPRDKTSGIDELCRILNSSDSPKSKIEAYKQKINDPKFQHQYQFARRRNPVWDKFINAICTVFLPINMMRYFLYGSFFKIPEGEQIMQNSRKILKL